MTLQLDSLIIEGIPLLTIAPENRQTCPVVFFICGYGGTKENGLRIGYKLAQRGFFFASLDPLMHGERYHPQIDRAAEPEYDGIYPPETGLDTGVLFYRIIHQSMLDVQTLISHFAADPRLNTGRCGVTGLSMGGYASFSAFANLPQIKAAVPMIGIPSFSRRWGDIVDECRFSNPDWAAALDRKSEKLLEHTHFIHEIDPYEKLNAAAPRALFIQNCDFDSDQPKLYSVYAYRELLAAYQDHPQNLRLRIYPAGHEVTPEMEDEAVDWFAQHLSPEEA